MSRSCYCDNVGCGNDLRNHPGVELFISAEGGHATSTRQLHICGACIILGGGVPEEKIIAAAKEILNVKE